jgi:electron transport complex protein RnfD
MNAPESLPLLPPMPLLRTRRGLRGFNIQVLLALAPLVAVALVLYGPPAGITLATAALSFMITESLSKALSGNRQRLGDGHALATGLLFGLLLPPALPVAQVALAGLLGAFFAEQIFGGAGRAVVVPALFARGLLDLSGHPGQGLKMPLEWLSGGASTGTALAGQPLVGQPLVGQPLASALQQAWSALAELSQVGLGQSRGPALDLEQLAALTERTGAAGVLDFLLNLQPGTLAAGSLAALLPGGVLLVTRRIFDWKVPVVALAVFGTGVLLANASGLVHWPGLGLWLATTLLVPLLVLAAADCRHTPLTARGKWAYGLLVGLLLLAVPALGLGEGGLCAAVLLASLAMPWLDHLTLPRGPRP